MEAIGGLELMLGLLMLAGLATRPAAAMLAGDMVGAIVTAGRVEDGAINLGLAPGLLVVMLFLLWAGGDRWSLDERLRQAVSGSGNFLTNVMYVTGTSPEEPPRLARSKRRFLTLHKACSEV